MNKIRESALKEYASQHIQVLYNITLYGYYHNLPGDHENEKQHYFECYLIHLQAETAIKRILSERDNKITLPKINIECDIQALKQYENFLENQKGSDNK